MEHSDTGDPDLIFMFLIYLSPALEIIQSVQAKLFYITMLHLKSLPHGHTQIS